MKILLFTEIFDSGGIDTFIINLINNWPNSEDEFVLISNMNYPGLKIIKSNVKKKCLYIEHNYLIYSNFLSKSRLQKVFRKLLSPLLRYALILVNIIIFKKLIIKINADKLMVINGGYPGGDSCRAFTISWGYFGKDKLSIHNFHNIAVKAPLHSIVQEYFVDYLIKRYTRYFVSVSNASAKSIKHRLGFVKIKNLKYIYNGINANSITNLQKTDIRREIGILPNAPLCLMLATYEERKGHLFLFTAFKRVLDVIPNAHLLVCGFGFPHEIRRVSDYITRMKLSDNVTLMPFRVDVSNLFENANLLVVPSQSFESFGYISIEAMLHRIPVVATNVGGIPEVVVNNEGGICVDSADINSFADGIIKYLLNKELSEQEGERGFSRCKKLFSASAMSAAYCDLINS